MNDPHILGTERIGKLLVQYSIPAIPVDEPGGCFLYTGFGRRFCHFVHTAGAERYGRGSGSVEQHPDALPGQLIPVWQHLFLLPG